MPRQVVVAGGGVGGLSGAIHARLRGFDVLVVEQREVVGGKAAPIEESGFRFDPGPSIIILTRIYEEVFRLAGKRMEDYLTFRRLDPISRVQFEGRTLDLPSSRKDCEALVHELDPSDGRSFADLMQRLDGVARHVDQSVFRRPYEKPWHLADPHLVAMALPFDVRKSYRELVDGRFRSPLLRAFFYGFPSYGGQTYDSKAPGALLIPYYMLQEGVWYPEGGVAAIPAAFRRLAADLGVEFALGERVSGLLKAGNRVRGVTTEGGRSYEADAVISNIDRSTVGAWLGRDSRSRPSFSYFTIHWGLHKQPEGLAHHTLVIPPNFEEGIEALYRERKLPQPPIIYLNETSATDSATAPPGAGNLFAVITTPAMEAHLDWPAEATRYRNVVVETLLQSGLDVEGLGIEVERIQTPVTFQQRDGNYLGSLYGVDEQERPMGGLFPFPPRDPEFRNLVYCGGSVQPGAGLPMVTLSGRFAAEAI